MKRLICRPLPVVLLLTVMISGCGVRFMYRQLDWLVPWYVYGYVDLEPDQRSLLEQRLQVHINWHCKTQLPVYSAWLGTLADDPRLALGRPQLDRHYQQLLEYWRTLAARITPDLSRVMAGASDQQVAMLLQNLGQRNQRFIDRYVTPGPEERHRNRINRMARQLRRWAGPLTDSQQQAVVDWSSSLQPMAEQWLAARRNWQQALGQALEERADGRLLERRFYGLLVDPRQRWSTEFRTLAERNEELTLEFLAAFGASLQPRQMARLKGELRELAADFEALACP